MRVRPLLTAAVVGLLAIAAAGLVVNAVGFSGASADAGASTASVDPPPLDGGSTNGTVACPTGAGATVRERLDAPALVELYPNPTTEGNVGEYAVLDTPTETAVGNWTLTDGHTVAEFPNTTVDGRVALTIDADATEALTAEEPLELGGFLRLAADGDALELRDGDKVIDAVAYERAPTAEIWYRDETASRSEPVEGAIANGTEGDTSILSKSSDGRAQGTWWPREATCVPPTTGNATNATAFVLPDAPDVARETIRSADERILLAGYTFTSERIAAELIDAAGRGVDVRVLVEASPVGGTPADAEAVLADLEAGGVEVRATGGEGARYDFHHPKYAVADETVLIATENWKPSGIDGRGSRGWGVALTDPELATALAAVFRTDFEGWDTEPGERFRERATFVEEDDRPERRYPAEFEPETVAVESTELLVAPDNAEGRLLELIENAEDDLLVKQASLGGTDAPLVEAVVEVARRGVEVRILLDSSWYVEEENRAVAAELERTASEDNLPIEVELVEPGNRFEKIHAKGVVIDGETAVVGSANWNDNAFENNREVLLVLHGDRAAAYYAAVFEDDWAGESWPLPVEFGAVAVASLLAAAVVGHRYVRFGGERPPPGNRSFDPNSDARNGSVERSADEAASSTDRGWRGGEPITIVPDRKGEEANREREEATADSEP